VQQTPAETLWEINSSSDTESNFLNDCLLFNKLKSHRLREDPTNYQTLVEVLNSAKTDEDDEPTESEVEDHWSLEEVEETINDINELTKEFIDDLDEYFIMLRTIIERVEMQLKWQQKDLEKHTIIKKNLVQRTFISNAYLPVCSVNSQGDRILSVEKSLNCGICQDNESSKFFLAKLL